MIDSVIKIVNLLLTKSNKEYINLYEILNKTINIPNPKPNIKHFQTYYYIIYHYIKKERYIWGDKFIERTKRSYLVKYSNLKSKVFLI